jgi:SAM-dependent methyltransferase
VIGRVLRRIRRALPGGPRPARVAITDELRLAEVRVTPEGAVLDLEIRWSPRLASVPAAWADADVTIGLHWLGAGGEVLLWDGPRTEPIPLRWVALTPFRRSLAIGSRPAGAAELRLELVAEGVMWGESAGLAPLRFGATSPPEPAPVAPRDHGPAPPAEAPAVTRAWLAAGWPRDAAPQEMADYVGADLARFLMSVRLMPDDPGRILEVGSNPYFISRLITRLHPGCDLRMTNYFGSPGEAIEQDIVDATGTVLETFSSELVDTEIAPLPYPDDHFDTVLLCEVIEHLVRDPVFQLAEIARVLRPGGAFILTTPNVARAANRGRLAQRQGIYDPYSRYGLHGRHNREYTAEEILELTDGIGFTAEAYLTRPVHTVREPEPEWFAGRDDDGAGDYHFLRMRLREDAPSEPIRPAWLYR